MSTQTHFKAPTGQPVVYQVRIKGHLPGQWQDWFGGLAITLEDRNPGLGVIVKG